MTLPTPPRKQWFLDRIGTRVWPSKSNCNCGLCAEDYNNGVFIGNERDASKAYATELIDLVLTHFETKEQRDEHARTNPS